MSDTWAYVIFGAVVFAPMLLPILLVRPTAYDRLLCKRGHDWVDEGWMSSCSKCPAAYNHYDRPGGAG